MYRDYFQFQQDPFSLTPDPRFVYLSRGHQAALEHLVYGVKERKGFVLITGTIGAGKTTLTRLFLEQIEGRGPTALIFNTSLNEIELLRSINREFGLAAEAGSRDELIRTLNDFLIEKLCQDQTPVLILDEAQNLSVPVLEQIRMLSNLETDQQKLIQIVLVGQPELAKTLARPDLTQLAQRITVRCNLGPLAPDDTIRYIHHRLTVAGPRSLARFTPKAYQWIHRCSQGIPRQINALCDRALLTAFAQGAYQITPALVRRAQAEITGQGAGMAPDWRRRKAWVPAALALLGLLLAGYWTLFRDGVLP